MSRTPFAYWPETGAFILRGRAKYFQGSGDDRKRRLLGLYAGSDATTFRMFKFKNRYDFRFLPSKAGVKHFPASRRTSC